MGFEGTVWKTNMFFFLEEKSKPNKRILLVLVFQGLQPAAKPACFSLAELEVESKMLIHSNSKEQCRGDSDPKCLDDYSLCVLKPGLGRIFC